MARWAQVEAEAPELAARAKAYFEAFTHKTIATLRRDGSPRISGIEAAFGEDGELTIGSMLNGVKALDLRRDGRFALHSGSPNEWSGDAKLAGRAVEIESDAKSHTFRLDITELVVVSLNAERTKLVIESWHEGRGLSRRER